MATTTASETKTLVNYRVEDGVAVIELNDPPANTYTYEMNRQLDECILKARMDNNVYVLLLTGAGDKFFSAGANIKMLAAWTRCSNTTSACMRMKRCCAWNRRPSW